MKLETMESVVEGLLRDYPVLRGNDRKLYLAYLWKKGFSLNVTIKDFLNDDTYPSYESVTRCRRKLQERDFELLPEERIQEERQKNEERYLDYARR